MESIIIVNFDVESEAYQALTELKKNAVHNSYTVSEAFLAKNTNGHVASIDGFDTGAETRNDTRAGGLIGALLGIAGGPLGIVLMGGYGALVGSAIDWGDAMQNASKAFVRSFSEAIAEEVKGTGVTVTALCPGPTSTGFEAADMSSKSNMFKKAAKAEDVAKAGIRALQKGKALCYQGSFTKWIGFLCRLVPRSVTRKYAAKMDK